MIEKIPPAICADAAHSEIVIILLLIVIGWIVRMYWKEKNKNAAIETEWKARIESKLDDALSKHQDCQKQLPEKYVMRQEFMDLQRERNHQWELFNQKFEKLIEKFDNHRHDTNSGIVERL